MLFGRKRNDWKIMVLIGIGLCTISGYQWHSIKAPSESDLTAAIEDRYQVEIAEMQKDAGDAPLNISPEWRDKFHAAIRAELLQPVEDQKRPIYAFLALGLFSLVIGIGSLTSSLLEKSKSDK